MQEVETGRSGGREGKEEVEGVKRGVKEAEVGDDRGRRGVGAGEGGGRRREEEELEEQEVEK